MRLKSKVGRECEGQFNINFSTMKVVSYSFACHVTCKVKYFGKVANVFEGKTMFFHMFCSTVVP